MSQYTLADVQHSLCLMPDLLGQGDCTELRKDLLRQDDGPPVEALIRDAIHQSVLLEVGQLDIHKIFWRASLVRDDWVNLAVEHDETPIQLYVTAFV